MHTFNLSSPAVGYGASEPLASSRQGAAGTVSIPPLVESKASNAASGRGRGAGLNKTHP